MTVLSRKRYTSASALAVVYAALVFVTISLGLLLLYREWQPRRNADFRSSSLIPTDGLVIEAVPDVHCETEQNRSARTERELSILMQRIISYLQNPENCTSAKKLVCSFVISDCGFGCLMHQVVFCFIMAYATERTLVMDSAGWRYSSEGLETAFLPVSKCSVSKKNLKSKNPVYIQYYSVITLILISSLCRIEETRWT